MLLSLRTRERVRSGVPWWAKGALKLSLSRLPLGYATLRAMSLARHGGMDRPAWAYDVFQRHFDSADFHRRNGGFSLLELGPGDSLFSALIGKARGASSVCLVDIGPFAGADFSLYLAMADFLKQRGLDVPDLSGAKSVEDVLAACSARYEIDGLASLQAIADESIDYTFSNVVLQSVRRDQLSATLKELRRITHPCGCSVHSVDLRDFMGQSLHHLRFSQKVWESSWCHRAGFYTNRLRLSELVAACHYAGFETELAEVNRWAEIPLDRKKLAAPYQQMPEDDLLAATIRIVLRPSRANEFHVR
jgi:hypothetical protein